MVAYVQWWPRLAKRSWWLDDCALQELASVTKAGRVAVHFKKWANHTRKHQRPCPISHTIPAVPAVMHPWQARIDPIPIKVGLEVYEQGISTGIAPEAWETIHATKLLLKASPHHHRHSHSCLLDFATCHLPTAIIIVAATATTHHP